MKLLDKDGKVIAHMKNSRHRKNNKLANARQGIPSPGEVVTLRQIRELDREENNQRILAGQAEQGARIKSNQASGKMRRAGVYATRKRS